MCLCVFGVVALFLRFDAWCCLMNIIVRCVLSDACCVLIMVCCVLCVVPGCLVCGVWFVD